MIDSFTLIEIQLVTAEWSKFQVDLKKKKTFAAGKRKYTFKIIKKILRSLKSIAPPISRSLVQCQTISESVIPTLLLYVEILH